MKYKFLVLDLDGTLTNSKKEISPRNMSALLQLQELGVQLILASGRPTYGITPLAKMLRMDHFGGFILSFNGGKILNVKNMEVIYEQVVDRKFVPQIYAAATEAHAGIITYLDDTIITEVPDNKYVAHESFLTKMTTVKVDSFCEAVTFDPDKCLIVGEPDDLIPLCEQLNGSALSEDLSFYRSEPFFLEAVPKGIDKALSLTRLMKHTGNDVSEIIAVGDGFNDISMIQLAGLGVAMANAQDPVKEAADRITLSNDEDGVAALVEEIFSL